MFFFESLNSFRLIGDLLHLASIIILLRKIFVNGSSAGVSLKTIQCYMIVFVCRYLDIFFAFHSLYNTSMKIFYLSSTATILYLMLVKYPNRNDRQHDSFRLIYLIAPCLVLALFINDEFSIIEVLWSFSIFLESVSIMPQLFLLQRTKEVESFTADYIITLGLYRAFYILNWIDRYFWDGDYIDWWVWVGGIVQTILYADFFYYYARSKWYGQKVVLP